MGQSVLSLTEGCGLAGGTIFLLVSLSHALRCSLWWARLGRCCQRSPPKPVLGLLPKTFLWENPDLVEWCLWESPGERLVRRSL